MKDFWLLVVVTVMFAVTFALAGVTALFVAHGIPLIELCSGEYGLCVDISASQMFTIAALFSTIALGLACVASLMLHENKMPWGFVLPVWTAVFASLVAYLSNSGVESVSTYFGANLWLPVTLLFSGYLYLLARRYRRESRPRRLKRDGK